MEQAVEQKRKVAEYLVIALVFIAQLAVYNTYTLIETVSNTLTSMGIAWGAVAFVWVVTAIVMHIWQGVHPPSAAKCTDAVMLPVVVLVQMAMGVTLNYAVGGDIGRGVLLLWILFVIVGAVVAAAYRWAN